MRREPEIVLEVGAKQCEAPVAIELGFRRKADEACRHVDQEIRQVQKAVDAQAEGRVDHVLLVVLGEQPRLDQVAPLRVREVVLEAEDVLHQAQIRRALRPEALDAADVDRAHQPTARNELAHRLRGVGLDVLPDAGAAETDPRRVQRAVRQHVAVFAGKELVAREELARELRKIGRQELAGVVERVAPEQLVAGAEVVVHASLHEVLVEPLVEREGVLGQSLPERRTVRARELRQIGSDERIDRHCLVRQDAEARVVVGDDR